MEKIDVTVKRDGAPAITLTFTETEPDAARERLEFLTFVLRPFTGTDIKKLDKPLAKAPISRTAPPPAGAQQ